MQAPASSLSFLQAREAFLRAMAKHQNQEQKLFNLFGVSNSADLDEAILQARSTGMKHQEEITLLSTLGHQLDRASDVYDHATEMQRRKIAEQQKQFHKDIQSLEC
jgi:hypothetical protein